jgi:hypothetical protein
MAQETQLLKLDLDTKEFISKLDAAEAKLGEIGKPESLSGLVEGLAAAGKVLGVIGAAGIAAKAALDMTLEAESVRGINQQFDILTRNAGISGDALKTALGNIADGLVDDEDLLKAASQGVVQLGDNAGRMADIFSLAKQVTTSFGGDLLANFERINQAIATGNARSLKQYGLIVDQDKALRDYAKSVGITVDALSDQERKTAILNATIEKGKTAFKGVSDDVYKVTNLWKQFQVAIGNVGEAFSIAFEKIAGKGVQNALSSLTYGAKLAGLTIQAAFGSEAEKAAANQDKLKLKLKDTEEQITKTEAWVRKFSESMAASGGMGDPSLLSAYSSRLGELNKQREQMVAELAKLQPAGTAGAGEETASRQIASDQDTSSRRLAVASKFEADLLNLRMARINQEIEVSTSTEEIDRLQAERKQAMLEMLFAKEEQVRASVLEGKTTEAQAEQQLMEYRKAAIADMRRVEQKAEDERLRALQNLAAATANTAAGFTNGFKAAAASASKDVGNFSKLGATAFDSFSKNAKNAFMDLGRGTKSAADVMKSFFLNALADIAEGQGTIMLANIFNPASMAAGAGLLVLAGVLRGLAGEGGGGGKSGSIGAATASSGGGGGYTSSAMDMERPQVEESRRKREVQLVIQGNYFETEQTKRTLMEMIRSETDATGFSYVQIGQGA